MYVNIISFGTVEDIKDRDDLQLVSVDTEVNTIKEFFGNNEDINEFDGFFVKVGDGEYEEIYAFKGTVPNYDDELWKLEMSDDEKIITLASFLGESIDGITDEGDNRYSVGNQEYLVLNDEEADKAVKDYIRDSVWSFNADFIAGECGIYEMKEMIESFQQKCEGANDAILKLIEKTCGLDSFVESAVSADGRGHFLAGYDGNENEEGDYFIYRTN